MALDKTSTKPPLEIGSADELDSLCSRACASESWHDGKTTPLERNLKKLLHNLDPYQEPGVWVFAEVPRESSPPAGTVSMVLEDEGCTVVLREEDAKTVGLEPLFRAAWITLRVHSALEAVGLVAEVSSCLARAGISCNVLAGARHDHILVPFERAEEALIALAALQSEH